MAGNSHFDTPRLLHLYDGEGPPLDRGVFQKGGWHPQPIHGQPDVVLSEASSQKLVFFASFYKILIKVWTPAGPPEASNQK